MAVDFLAIGHVTHDRTPEGIRLGGTVSYAAVTCRRLGGRPGILTRAQIDGLLPGLHSEPGAAQADALGGAELYLLPSTVSTTFTNIYHGGRRVQVIESVAAPIVPADLPPAFVDAPVVLLGPIAREVPASWAGAFPRAIVGISAQGCMRTWDSAGHVTVARWADAAEYLRHAAVLFLSREDVGGDDEYLLYLSRLAHLMVVTDGWRGSAVYRGGQVIQVPPRPSAEVDPTGAGDVFATAFLIRLAETGDPYRAARFANVTASFSVEGPGAATIPSRAQVEAWLAEHA